MATILFSLVDAETLAGLRFEVDYSGADGEFVGEGDGVQCMSLIMGVPIIDAYLDNDAARVLSVAVATAEQFSGPGDVVACAFQGAPPDARDFLVTVLEATRPDLVDVDVTVVPGLPPLLLPDGLGRGASRALPTVEERW